MCPGTNLVNKVFGDATHPAQARRDHALCPVLGHAMAETSTLAQSRRLTAMYLYEAMGENPREPFAGRERPIQRWSTETGAERGASRPLRRAPAQWPGALCARIWQGRAGQA